MVFNFSASYIGQKLDYFLAKGPDILDNLLLGVLLRFRQEKKIDIIADVLKIYHTIKLSTLDPHSNNVWRDIDNNRKLDH